MTLRELRLQAGKTAVDAAKELSVTTQSMYRYEDGTRQLKLEQIPMLAKLYDVEIDEIVSAAILTLNSYQFALQGSQQEHRTSRRA